MRELGQLSGATLGPQQETRHLGLVLAGVGTLALMVACVQHWRYTKRLRHGQANVPWDLTLMVAPLVVCLGLLILGGLVLRLGPFA